MNYYKIYSMPNDESVFSFSKRKLIGLFIEKKNAKEFLKTKVKSKDKTLYLYGKISNLDINMIERIEDIQVDNLDTLLFVEEKLNKTSPKIASI